MKIIHGLQAVVTIRLNGSLLPWFLAIILSFISCKKPDPDPEPYVPVPYTIRIPRYFPDKLNIPADNPMTVEGVALGRYLFYDGRLSGRTDPDSLMTCYTCHLQSRSFECGIDHSEIYRGRNIRPDRSCIPRSTHDAADQPAYGTKRPICGTGNLS